MMANEEQAETHGHHKHHHHHRRRHSDGDTKDESLSCSPPPSAPPLEFEDELVQVEPMHVKPANTPTTTIQTAPSPKPTTVLAQANAFNHPSPASNTEARPATPPTPRRMSSLSRLARSSSSLATPALGSFAAQVVVRAAKRPISTGNLCWDQVKSAEEEAAATPMDLDTLMKELPQNTEVLIIPRGFNFVTRSRSARWH